MNTWILLERPAAQLETLYRLATHPDTQKLFAGTSLDGFAEHSPLLVRLNNQPTLIQAIEQIPAQWPGLLIESTCDTPSVLAHLRQMLFVNFDQQRKGVLRYSNPTVASYFLPRVPRKTSACGSARSVVCAGSARRGPLKRPAKLAGSS